MLDADRLWRLVDLSPEALDALPFGAIVVDRRGTVLQYNSYESRMSRLDAARVLGLNFFRDIAPCTAVQEFEGRLKAFARSIDRGSETFSYFFPFAHGPVDVSITFLRLDSDRFLIAVERADGKV